MMKKEIIYLDHAAATPMDKKVLSAMQPYYVEKFYNPSSPYSPAVEVRQDYDLAKQKIANLIGARSGDVTITAGATESINLAFNGISGSVITTEIEHQAVLACAKKLKHDYLPVDKHGLISVDNLKKTVKDDTQLISIGLANNEIGTIQPIREIAEIVKKERQERLMNGNDMPIYLHSDASQGFNLLDVNVARLGVDMLTLNAGKVYGPKQVGLLWSNSQVKLTPQITGGGQEDGFRSGTENVAGVVGFAKALEIASEHRAFEAKRLLALKNHLRDFLIQQFPEAVPSGHPKHQLDNFLHISFPNLDGERLVFLLEDEGVLVATGSACAANKGSGSHVLKAIGLTDGISSGSLRMTLGQMSNEENIKLAGDIIAKVVKKEYQRMAS